MRMDGDKLVVERDDCTHGIPWDAIRDKLLELSKERIRPIAILVPKPAFYYGVPMRLYGSMEELKRKLLHKYCGKPITARTIAGIKRTTARMLRDISKPHPGPTGE